MGSQGGTVLPNNTYSGGKASHVGQLFFDQSLITQVEATAAYSVNRQPITTNANDNIFKESAANDFDPVINYVLLDDSVIDGVFGWVSVGINKSLSKSVTAAATFAGNSSSTNATTTTATTTTQTSTPTPSPTSNASSFTSRVSAVLGGCAVALAAVLGGATLFQ